MSDLRSRATTRERARLSFTAIAYLLFSRRRTTFEQSIRDIAPYTSDRFRPRRRWKRSNPLSGPPKRIPPTIRLSGLRRPPVTQRAPASRSLVDAVMLLAWSIRSRIRSGEQVVIRVTPDDPNPFAGLTEPPIDQP